MLDTHEIVMLPSASILPALRRDRANRPPAQCTVAVFADPVYETGDSRLAQLQRATTLPNTGTTRGDDNLTIPKDATDVFAV